MFYLFSVSIVVYFGVYVRHSNAYTVRSLGFCFISSLDAASCSGDIQSNAISPSVYTDEFLRTSVPDSLTLGSGRIVSNVLFSDARLLWGSTAQVSYNAFVYSYHDLQDAYVRVTSSVRAVRSTPFSDASSATQSVGTQLSGFQWADISSASLPTS